MKSEDTLRLFFALPCPAGLAAAICAWRDGLNLSGRPVAQANLHLTLAFLGNQPHEKLEDFLQLAASLGTESFTLRLDRLSTIGKGFTCLMPSQTPPALHALATELACALMASGIHLDSRPFLPHLTLLRQASPQPRTDSPVFNWHVQRFGLYLSANTPGGVRYRELASWPLANPGD